MTLLYGFIIRQIYLSHHDVMEKIKLYRKIGYRQTAVLLSRVIVTDRFIWIWSRCAWVCLRAKAFMVFVLYQLFEFFLFPIQITDNIFVIVLKKFIIFLHRKEQEATDHIRGVILWNLLRWNERCQWDLNKN